MPLNPSEIITPPETHLRVSLPRLLARLHLGDCMTCAAPMTPGIKHSLVLQTLGNRLLASLHHVYCQDPVWLDHHNPTISTNSTYVFEWMLLGDLPIALINPSLESIFLIQNGNGIWVPTAFDQFNDPGALKTAKVHFEPKENNWNAKISITDKIGGQTVYEGIVTGDFNRYAKEKAKMNTYLTHLHHPSIPISKKRLWEIIQTPDTLSILVPVT